MSSNASQYQIDPNSHPADQAMAREQAGSPPSSNLTAQELATYSSMSPGDLVSSLANADIAVPVDSPLRKMTTDELKTAMRQSMTAIQDFRAASQSLGTLEAKIAATRDPSTITGTPMIDASGNIFTAGGEYQKTEAAVEKSRRSAAAAGLRNFEYDQAMAQLAASAPDARPQPAADSNETPATAANGKPYEITKGPDGSYTVRLDTNENFRGANADEIIEELAKSKRKTSIWGRDLNAQLKQYRSGQTPTAPVPSEPVQATTEQPQFGADADALARTLGFAGIEELAGEWQRVQQRLQAADQFASTYADQQVAETFIMQNPDFPGSQHALETLVKIMDASDLDYSKVENLGLAHQHAIRQGLYKPLTQDDVQAGIRGNENPAGRHVPPPPPQSSAPGADGPVNPWQMSTDQLRKAVLEQGGLGKVLLNMRPGESFGG